MAIEVLDQGATRVMGTFAERIPPRLALGVSGFLAFEWQYDTPLDNVNEFVGVLSSMTWPNGDGGRSNSIQPLAFNVGFQTNWNTAGLGFSFVVYRIVKHPVIVTSFTP
jgi:hypothetical protein